jgi:lipoate-protein ligase A
VAAEHRPVNDVITPRGKLAGAAQARRRGAVLHHTMVAYALDPELVPALIRIGRPRVSERGLRSAEKAVSPLAWFVQLSLAEVEEHLVSWFARDHDLEAATIGADSEVDARSLARRKYATDAWIYRLP